MKERDQGKELRAKITNRDTENLKVPYATVNVARLVSILRRHVSLNTLMGISTIFAKEL